MSSSICLKLLTALPIIAGLVWTAPIYAGQVTTTPSAVDTFGDVVIAPDGNVTFDASSAQGTVTIDRSASSFTHGTPSYSGSGSTAIVDVTFVDAATGKDNSCTVVVNHTVSSLSGGGTQQCAQEVPFIYNVIVPQITSKTVATTPATLDRVKLGIGELVNLTIAPTDAPTPTWAVDSGQGSLSTSTGSTSQYTASQSPDSPKISATVSGTKVTLSFNVIAPTGMSCTWTSDSPPGNPGPPNNNIGVISTFESTVLPTDVCFSSANLQENIPTQNFTWPNGSTLTWHSFTGQIAINQSNQASDICGIGLSPKSKLYSAGAYNGVTFNVSVPDQYQDASGGFTTFYTEIHSISFQANLQGIAGDLTTNNQYGNYMGPFQ